jgi:hypothetical protein
MPYGFFQTLPDPCMEWGTPRPLCWCLDIERQGIRWAVTTPVMAEFRNYRPDAYAHPHGQWRSAAAKPFIKY